MNIRLFNRACTVRRFSPPHTVEGYLTGGYEDFAASLHLFPAQADTQEAPGEGARRVRHLEGRGEIELFPADQDIGRPGDWVLWQGRWYECVSAVRWDSTLLSHWDYQFIAVPPDGAGETGEEADHDAH